MPNAPVVLFVYNRADHFRQTFAALAACREAKDTVLYIYADGPKDAEGKEKVDVLRSAVHETADNSVFKEVHIIEAERNRGLAASVIAGVTEVLNAFGSAIVLEDDSVVAPSYLRFMNDALDIFRSDKRVGAIAGYTPSISFPD
ncbi:MAG: glycosyltransferase, partial [Clostridia bacterium]|nr:glycosyltransferase [Clostridia bacterium]